jgi:hypothetical protein
MWHFVKVICTIGVLCTCLTPSGPALANGTDTTDRIDRLEQVLEVFASDARKARLSSALAQSTVSAATLVPGVLLDRRSDSDLQLFGIGFIIAGSIQLGLSPLFLIASPVEKIRARFLEGIERGENPEALANRIEADLKEAAAHKSASRPYSGGGTLLFGAAAFATGMTFLFVQPGVAGMGARSQRIWGAALVGMGAPFAQQGIRSLLQRSPEEAAWNSYQLESSRPTSHGPNTSFSLAPTYGGMIVTVGTAL